MNTFMHYPFALVYGLYLYVVFQILFFVYFGSFNFTLHIIDLGIYIVGTLSVLILLFFMRRLPQKRWSMLIPFVIAVPVSYFGTLAGGLFGMVVMVTAGIAPFIVLMPVGYWITRFALSRSTSAARTPGSANAQTPNTAARGERDA